MATFSRTFNTTNWIEDEIAETNDGESSEPTFSLPALSRSGYNTTYTNGKLGNYKSKSSSSAVKYMSCRLLNSSVLPHFHPDRITITQIEIKITFTKPDGDTRNKYFHMACGDYDDIQINFGTGKTSATMTLTSGTAFENLCDWLYGARENFLVFYCYDTNTTYTEMNNGHYYSRNYLVSMPTCDITVYYEYPNSVSYLGTECELFYNNNGTATVCSYKGVGGE